MIFIRFQAVFAIVVAAAGLLSVHSAKAEPQTDALAKFVGAQACAGCHAPEVSAALFLAGNQVVYPCRIELLKLGTAPQEPHRKGSCSRPSHARRAKAFGQP